MAFLFWWHQFDGLGQTTPLQPSVRYERGMGRRFAKIKPRPLFNIPLLLEILLHRKLHCECFLSSFSTSPSSLKHCALFVEKIINWGSECLFSGIFSLCRYFRATTDKDVVWLKAIRCYRKNEWLFALSTLLKFTLKSLKTLEYIASLKVIKLRQTLLVILKWLWKTIYLKYLHPHKDIFSKQYFDVLGPWSLS